MASIIVLSPVGGETNGADIAANHQIRRLRELGHDVTLVTRQPVPAEYRAFLAQLGVDHRELAYGWWADLEDVTTSLADSETISALIRIIEERACTVAVTNTAQIPWLALAAAATATPHLWLIHEFPEGQFAATRDTYDFIGAYSSAVLAASDTLAATLAPLCAPTAVSHFFPYTQEPTISDDPSGTPRLVSVNHVSAEKNTAELVDLYATLQPEQPDLTLALRGGIRTQDYYETLRASVVGRGIPGVEWSTDPQASWAGVRPTDIVVHTSRVETFSLTLVETLKAGLVTLAARNHATDSMTALGYLTDDDVYEPGNLAEARTKLRRKLADPAAARERARATRAIVLADQSLASTTAPLADAVTNAASPPRPELAHFRALFSAPGEAAARRAAHVAHLERLLADATRDRDVIAGSRAYRVGRAITAPARVLRRWGSAAARG